MAQKKLLTNGTASKCNDGRWHGTVWYLDETGTRTRRAFSGTGKKDVEKKMKEYTEHFYDDQIESDEIRRPLKESMQRWLEVFKLPSIERTTPKWAFNWSICPLASMRGSSFGTLTPSLMLVMPSSPVLVYICFMFMFLQCRDAKSCVSPIS